MKGCLWAGLLGFLGRPTAGHDHQAGAPEGTEGEGYVHAPEGTEGEGYVFPYDELNVPPGWTGSREPNDRHPRTCNADAERACEAEYLSCQLYSGPANDAKHMCTCAGQFYGICLREVR